MRKKLLFPVLALAVVVAAGGCYGPMNWTRTFDDWSNQNYVDSPWLAQVMFYSGITPAVTLFTNLVDYMVLNVIDFWSESAFEGRGTKFIHRNPVDPEER